MRRALGCGVLVGLVAWLSASAVAWAWSVFLYGACECAL